MRRVMGLTAGLVVFVVGCAPQSTGLNGVRVGLEPGATEGPAGRGIDGESRAASLGLGFEASPVRHVVVIGGGVAGLAAAASAAEAGARVTLLEAMDELGGRALSAGAGMTFAGTSLQAEKGVEDSPDRAVEEWEEVTGAPADGWAVSFLEDSADVYDWLSNHGLPFCAVSASPLVTTPRIHTPCDDQGGEALVEILVDGLPFGVDVRLGTRVVDIEASGGQVGGVWIHGPGNGSGGSFDEGEFVFADRVVIATGGFSQREDWLDEVLTIETLDVSPSVGRGGDGVGLDWAMDHDWAVSDLSSLGFFALGFQDVDGVPVVLNSVHPRWLWVNEQGRRFADETETGSVRSTGEALGQLGAWVVMDSESFDDFNTGAYEAAESLVEAGLAARADTLGALAGHIGVDALTLLESLDTVAEGTDPDILRDREDGLVLDSPPYYGVRLLLGAVKNFGGLVLDEDSRVLDGQLEPIEGLYAAGEVSGMARPGVGGLWGWDGSLGAVIWSGWQAGESAASP